MKYFRRENWLDSDGTDLRSMTAALIVVGTVLMGIGSHMAIKSTEGD